MKRLSITLFLISLSFILTYFNINSSNAAIHFISKSDSITSQSSSKPCIPMGYKLTKNDCSKHDLELSDTCPEDPQYGKTCSCDKNTFQYDTSNCSGTKSASGELCGGKYSICDCNASIYKYFSNSDCPKDKEIDKATNCVFIDKKIGYSKCTCSSQFSETCSGDLEGVGTDCDGKYTSCRCKSNFMDCGGRKGDIGSSSCVDSEGTKYTSCQPENCPSGTVDANTYWGGNLKYFINVSGGTVVGGKRCITLPSCESLGYSRTCNTEFKLTCPFDSSKAYCLD